MTTITWAPRFRADPDVEDECLIGTVGTRNAGQLYIHKDVHRRCKFTLYMNCAGTMTSLVMHEGFEIEQVKRLAEWLWNDAETNQKVSK